MKNDQTYESEREGDTLGNSDTSESNSVMEEEGDSSEETKRMSEDEHKHLMDRDRVKDSWEDDRIVESGKDKAGEESG